VTEYLRFGQAEGGVGDVAQLDQLLRALQVGREFQTLRFFYSGASNRICSVDCTGKSFVQGVVEHAV
jgi:hypothetical protein